MKSSLVLIFMVGLFMTDIVAVLSDFHQDGLTPRRKRHTESSSFFFYQQPEYPRDCKEVYDQCEGQSADGVYLIKAEGSPEPFEVYCNNSIDGGGWTVLQRRLDGSVDFNRNWDDFKIGFGFLRGEFWLGNDKISYVTNQKNYQLRIDLNNVNGEPFFAKYDLFRISDEFSRYRLVGLGNYGSTSTANFDAMGRSENDSFVTPDKPLNPNAHNCAVAKGGSWWYKINTCGFTRLNSLYNAGSVDTKSIWWANLPGGAYHIKYTEMKIRPVQDS